MNNLVRKLFWVSRPISWVNTAYPFAAGYLVSGGRVNALFIVATLYFLGPYNLLMYGVNDVFDYESDIRNPRKGGVEGMREEKALHPTILVAAPILNLPFLLWLMVKGDAAANLTLGVVVFMVIAYSIKGLRFKEKPFLDSVTSSSHFVGPLVYALSVNNFPAAAWPFVAAFFFWGMASHAFGAVQDIIPDKKGNLDSVATTIGAKATVRLSIGLYIISVATLLTQGWFALPVAAAILAYVVNIWPYRSVSDAGSGKTNHAWRRFLWLNQVTGFVVTMVLLVSAIY